MILSWIVSAEDKTTQQLNNPELLWVFARSLGMYSHFTLVAFFI